MFDIGFWELSLIAVIALLILGPERLPRVARTAGLWVGKMKRMVADVKSNIDEELRLEELSALKQAGEDIKQGLSSTQKEFADAGSEFKSSVEKAAIDEEDIDIVSAIRESAPKPDTVNDSDSTSRASAQTKSEDSNKKKTKTKVKRKIKKRADSRGEKKTGRKKSAVEKPSADKSSMTGKRSTGKKSARGNRPVNTKPGPSAAKGQVQEQPPAGENPPDQIG